MIKYNIEEKSIINCGNMKKIFLKGWVYSTNGEISIKISSKKNKAKRIEMEWLERRDVYEHFDKDYRALNSGFILWLDTEKGIFETLKINITSSKGDKQILKINKFKMSLLSICNCLNFNNIKKLFFSLLSNGFSETREKIKQQLFSRTSISRKREEVYIFNQENFKYPTTQKIIAVLNFSEISLKYDEITSTLNSLKGQSFFSIIALIHHENTVLNDYLSRFNSLSIDIVKMNEEIIENMDLLIYINDSWSTRLHT